MNTISSSHRQEIARNATRAYVTGNSLHLSSKVCRELNAQSLRWCIVFSILLQLVPYYTCCLLQCFSSHCKPSKMRAFSGDLICDWRCSESIYNIKFDVHHNTVACLAMSGGDARRNNHVNAKVVLQLPHEIGTHREKGSTVSLCMMVRI